MTAAMPLTTSTSPGTARSTRVRAGRESLDVYLDAAGRCGRLDADTEHAALVELLKLRTQRWLTVLGYPRARAAVARWLREHPDQADLPLEELEAFEAAAAADLEGARRALAARMARVDRGRGQDLVRDLRRFADGGDALALPASVRRRTDFCRHLEQVRRAHRAYLRARNRFACANLRLVVALASRYDNRRMSLADRVQEGNLGLLKAIERFDPDRGTRFSTYAAWWIRDGITSALTDHGREVRVPVHLHRVFMKARSREDALRRSFGRAPTLEELAEHVGCAPKRLRAARVAMEKSVVGLDAPIGRASDRVVADVLEDPTSTDVERLLDEERLIRRATASLATLDERERVILERRFGLDGRPPTTLARLGERLGVSRERVRQIQNRALATVRAAIEVPEVLAA